MRGITSTRKSQGRRLLVRMAQYFGLAFVLVVLITGPVFGAGRTLKGVGLIEEENQFKILIMAADSEPIQDYHIAYFPSPSRLLVDLEGKWDFPGYTDVKAENHVVRGIRVGEHPDKLRIAIDLKGNIVVSPIIEEMPGALALVIKPEYIYQQEGKKTGPRGKLMDIRTEDLPGQFKITFTGDRPITEYKSYMIPNDDPPKFVIDINGRWKNKKASAISVDSELVRRVRIGEHSNYLRVVTELTAGKSITPLIGKVDRDLILTIKQ